MNSEPPEAGEIARTLASVMRRDGPRLVAQLTRLFGARHLSLAEDMVQEAALSALSAWPRSMPDNPAAWLATAARNRALDHFRRNALFAALEPRLVHWTEVLASGALPTTLTGTTHAIADEELAMLFLCAHPALTPESQLVLILKSVCGLEVDEIARALLSNRAAIAQRLVRAKAHLRDVNAEFALPVGEELEARRAVVMRAIYLLFNEAYAATSGDQLLRDDLAREALRLANVLALNPATTSPEVHALCALIAFHHARAPARLDEEGALVLLEDQDRARWDQKLMRDGIVHMRASMGAPRLTVFHVEAGIAACHTLAPSFAATDWDEILRWYDILWSLAPSPIITLNQAVAHAMRDGSDVGYRIACTLENKSMLADYAPYHATLGELARRAGHVENALLHFRRALECACSEPMRNAIIRQQSRVMV